MRIDFITCLPALVSSPLEHSILKRAQSKGLLEVVVHDLRDYTTDKHRSVDDYPFGGGAGMVMKVEPIAACVRALKTERSYDHAIFMTPDGERLTQKRLNYLSLCTNLIILAGHYKGVDQRARDLFFDLELSIGDYVLSGGELPGLVLIDGIGRLIPGVLSDQTAALTDSFQDNLLDPPVYTRPAEFEGHSVPPVLLSGHAAEINKWRDQTAYEKTLARRPDLLTPNQS